MHSLRAPRSLVLLVLSATAVAACQPPPLSPSAVSRVDAPAADYRGIAARLTDHPRFGLVASSQEGEHLVAETRRGPTGLISEVTSAVFILPDRRSMVVHANDDGLPDSAVIDRTVVFFSNYTSDSVDLTLVSEDGSTHNYSAVPINRSHLASLRALRQTAGSVSPELAGQPQSFVSDVGRQLARGLKNAGLLTSIASCAFAVKATIATAGAAVVTTKLACTGLLIRIAAELDLDDSGRFFDGASGLLSTGSCVLLDPWGCTEMLISVATSAIDVGEHWIRSFRSNVPDGTWRGGGTGTSNFNTRAEVQITLDVRGGFVVWLGFPWRIYTPAGTAESSYCGGAGHGGHFRVPIMDKSFSILMQPAPGATGTQYEIRVNGRFTSSSQVSGTIDFRRVGQGGQSYCGSALISWSARR